MLEQNVLLLQTQVQILKQSNLDQQTDSKDNKVIRERKSDTEEKSKDNSEGGEQTSKEVEESMEPNYQDLQFDFEEGSESVATNKNNKTEEGD